jgi:steroid 5-alpha reductase family enzyme
VEFLQIYLVLAGVILGLMALLWLFSLAIKNSSIVDVFWGTGFVIFTWAAFLFTPGGFIARKLLLCLLVSIWGLRLSIHILVRNWGKPEDFRYQKWREEAGASWWWKSLFKVFILQGILLLIVATPLLSAQINAVPAHLTWLDGFAILVWLIGFVFEASGDWQLMRFKDHPTNQGKILATGVWRYTRHPNYFGDAMQWWAYYLIALAAGGWWTLFSPIITMLEKTLKETKPGYKEYIETTPEFIPWLPRRKK